MTHIRFPRYALIYIRNNIPQTAADRKAISFPHRNFPPSEIIKAKGILRGELDAFAAPTLHGRFPPSVRICPEAGSTCAGRHARAHPEAPGATEVAPEDARGRKRKVPKVTKA